MIASSKPETAPRDELLEDNKIQYHPNQNTHADAEMRLAATEASSTTHRSK
jgi:hypothetical protein